MEHAERDDVKKFGFVFSQHGHSLHVNIFRHDLCGQNTEKRFKKQCSVAAVVPQMLEIIRQIFTQYSRDLESVCRELFVFLSFVATANRIGLFSLKTNVIPRYW